jgi:hypothetical protein
MAEDAGRAKDLMSKWHNDGGAISFEELYQWSSRLLEAELDLTNDLDSRGEISRTARKTISFRT